MGSKEVGGACRVAASLARRFYPVFQLSPDWAFSGILALQTRPAESKRAPLATILYYEGALFNPGHPPEREQRQWCCISIGNQEPELVFQSLHLPSDSVWSVIHDSTPSLIQALAVLQ